MNNIQLKKFSEINLLDPFFDSLKQDYKEFEIWFNKKKDEKAYILQSENGVEAFLYLKKEEEAITDITPNLPPALRLKVGTFKVNPHGTRLGERFIKKILDHAINGNYEQAYVTIFAKHTALVNVFLKYGFTQIGEKFTPNGNELVLLRDFNNITEGLITANYPKFSINNNRKYLLALYPDFHTRLFPDSILNNESFNVIQDVSHTNSIHKVYICKMDVRVLNKGDLVLIYRTGDGQGAAFYRAVATSVCIVEEVKSKNNFSNLSDFLAYCEPYSIFDKNELEDLFKNNRLYIIKMLYNAALQKRVTRGNLIEKVGINQHQHWNFVKLTDEQFLEILKIGKVNESLIIN